MSFSWTLVKETHNSLELEPHEYSQVTFDKGAKAT